MHGDTPRGGWGKLAVVATTVVKIVSPAVP